jgi:acyl phosphate:glycerol-3-phosphate acyltransferase
LNSAFILVALLGYLIGSIPFAYIIVRRHTRLDLRKHGTGNIGATNAYDVTGKRKIGALVMTLDMLKGFVPVIIFELLGAHEVLLVLIPALVLGHCYPIWLRFRGGRGLATTAGALALVHPIAILLWSIAYTLTNKLLRNTHVAATLSTCACLLVLLFADDSLIGRTTLAFSGLTEYSAKLSISISIVLLIILSRYIRPFIQVLQGKSVQA